MTPGERASSLPADRHWLKLASGVFAALTVIGSGLVGSPLVGFIASVAGVVSLLFLLRTGIAVAAIGGAALLFLDPWLVHPHTLASVARLAVPLACAAIGGALYRRGGARPERGGIVRADQSTPHRDVAHSATTLAASRRARAAVPDDGLELDVVQRFLRDMRTTLGTDEVLLWRSQVAGGHLHLFASSAGSTTTAHIRTTPPVDALLDWTVRQHLVAGNSSEDTALFLAAPLGAPDRVHGVLGVYARDRGTMDHDRTKAELTRYADRAARLLELLADGRIAQRYRTRSSVLLKAAERIQNAPDTGALGHTVCQVALEASGASRAAFVLWDDAAASGKVLTVSPDHQLAEESMVTPDSLVGTACRERQRFSIGEARRMSPAYAMYASGEASRPMGSIAVVPLIRARDVLGAVVVESDEAEQVTQAEADTLGLLASVAGVALENLLRLETERDRASRDSLTGLPNRGVFDEQLRHRLWESDRFGQPVSLILLDVDHFKSVNDRYGHDAGDVVLVAVARAMERSIRNIDLCARYGGEELAVLLPQTGLAAAVEVAERIRLTIAAHEIPVSGRTLTITASLGVSCYPESTATHDGLFTSADQALYDAKGSGRNCTRASGRSIDLRGV